jgi:hypothetical protein
MTGSTCSEYVQVQSNMVMSLLPDVCWLYGCHIFFSYGVLWAVLSFPPFMSTLCHCHCHWFTVQSKLVMKQVVPSADFVWCYARVIIICELRA